MQENIFDNYPFDLYTKKIAEDKDACKDFFKENPVNISLLSQIYAYIASLKNFDKTPEGLIDSSTYLKNNFKGDSWHIGLHAFLLTEPRGNLIPSQIKQSDPRVINYSGLVPLILAAHKQLNDIPYNSWSIKGLHNLVNTDLLNIMSLKGTFPKYSNSELLKIRNSGLTPNSGKAQGIMKNPISSYALVGTANRGIPIEFIKLPKLAQTILTQIWVAYPAVRTNLMILDLNDWDNIPEPLETSEILQQTLYSAKVRTEGTLVPTWDI